MSVILVVDDNEDNIISASAIIRNNIEDAAILTADSGIECLSVAAEEDVDLILLDVHMPNMDGIETCAKLHENTELPYMPVILITAATTTPEDRAAGLNAGAEAFLSKPIDSVELTAHINAFLRLKKAEDRLRDRMLLLNELVESKTSHLTRLNAALETQIEERKNVEEELRTLSSRLVDLREEERKHLALELHDRIGQILTAQGMNLSMAMESIAAGDIEKAKKKLSSAVESLDSLADEIRGITTDLHPPLIDETGLVPALKWYAKQFSETTGVKVEISNDTIACLDSNSKTNLTFFRIAQEAMNNAVKHSEPKTISIELKSSDNGGCLMRIHNDGAGFDPFKGVEFTETQRLGMIGMKERAYSINADFDLESSPECGTTVTVTLPGKN